MRVSPHLLPSIPTSGPDPDSFPPRVEDVTSAASLGMLLDHWGLGESRGFLSREGNKELLHQRYSWVETLARLMKPFI